MLQFSRLKMIGARKAGEPRRIVVMFVHGPWYLGGDSKVQLQAIEHLDRRLFDPIAVATPRSEGWAELSQLADAGKVRLFPVDMGIGPSEAARPSRFATGLRFAATVGRLLAVAAREHVAVIHTLDRTRAAFAAALVARILRRGLVWHAETPWTSWSARVIGTADRVIAASRYIGSEYEKNGAPPERLRMIYNGIDVDQYAAGRDPASTRRALGIADSELVVLLPGRLSRYKGQMELLEAAPAILQAFPTTRIVFAGYDSSLQDPVELGDLAAPGGGSLQSILERRAADLGVRSRILFTGPTPNMVAFDAAADVVVVPSWAEPFGLVVAEAMAAGKPVVGFASGALPELIVHGETGFLTGVRDSAGLAQAIIALLGDPALRTRLGENGRARAAQLFSVQRFAREVEGVFVDVAARRSHSSPTQEPSQMAIPIVPAGS